MYNLLQKYEFIAIQKNQSSNALINECFNNAIRSAADLDLQFNTLSTAFIIDGNAQQLAKSLTVLDSGIREDWHAYGNISKLYLITDSYKTEVLDTVSHTLFPKTTIIPHFLHHTASTNSSQPSLFVNGTMEEKVKYIKINIASDILIWLHYNDIKCIYNNALNVTIGSNDWIKHKTMRTTGWNEYRLGDMVNGRRANYLYHKLHFPHSIAVQYHDEMREQHRKIKPRTINGTLLIKIMSTRNQIYPSDNTLVIHLRTGDVLDNVCVWGIHGSSSDRNQTELLFFDPIQFFAQFMCQFVTNNISNVVLVTGFHQKRDHTNSYNYIVKIKDWFELNNFKVSFRINDNPDEDFMFMSNSKFFVQNVGGFSDLIASIVEKRNGTVFNRNTISRFRHRSKNEIRQCLHRNSNHIHGLNGENSTQSINCSLSLCIANINSQQIHFLTANETKYKFRFKYPSFLFSDPGSGNTLTRLLIEYMTRIWSGSIYKDETLEKNGFKGEGICSTTKQVIVIKAHPETLKFEKNNFLRGCLCRKRKRKCKRKQSIERWDYSTAIFLIRNPWKSMFAMYNYIYGGKGSKHTRAVLKDNFVLEQFIKMVNDRKHTWIKTFTLLDLYKKYEFKHIVVKFETFFDENIDGLEKVAKFLYNDVYYQETENELFKRIDCIKNYVKEDHGRFGKIHRSHEDKEDFVSLEYAVDKLLKNNQTKVLCDFWDTVKEYAIQYNYTMWNNVSCQYN